jgi:hypothetical protein
MLAEVVLKQPDIWGRTELLVDTVEFSDRGVVYVRFPGQFARYELSPSDISHIYFK